MVTKIQRIINRRKKIIIIYKFIEDVYDFIDDLMMYFIYFCTHKPF